MRVNPRESIETLKKIYLETLSKLDPRELVRNAISMENGLVRIDGRPFPFKRLFLAGFGKGSTTMAAGAADATGGAIHRGMIITKHHHKKPVDGVEVLEAGHPVPDESSISATNQMIEMLEQAGEDDLVIMLISGGGSSLLESPGDGITLSDLQTMTNNLLRCGADIGEINTIRKHLSRVKGGGLARVVSPARCVSLILSDVIGSDISSIASGPTAPDPTTFVQCREILAKYDLQCCTPSSVSDLIEKGIRGEIEETAKPGNPALELCHNVILADNAIALKTLAQTAKNMGIKPVLLNKPATGPVETFAKKTGEMIEEHSNKPSPTLLLAGGELTVKIPDNADGLGGRNQHLAMLFIRDVIKDHPDAAGLFASTDGTDGPTDAGGAFAWRGLSGKRLDNAISKFNSYYYLNEKGGLLITGPTGNNLNDLFMIMY